MTIVAAPGPAGAEEGRGPFLCLALLLALLASLPPGAWAADATANSDATFTLNQTVFPRTVSPYTITVYVNASALGGGTANKQMYVDHWANNTVPTPVGSNEGTGFIFRFLSTTDGNGDLNSSRSLNATEELGLWTINIGKNTGTLKVLVNVSYNITTPANRTYIPASPDTNNDINVTFQSRADPVGGMTANVTWIRPDASIARAVAGIPVDPANGVASDLLPNADNDQSGTWTVQVWFKNANGNVVDFNDAPTLTVAAGVPEFPLGTAPALLGGLLYLYFRRRYGGDG
jgi:hypothetical protein